MQNSHLEGRKNGKIKSTFARFKLIYIIYKHSHHPLQIIYCTSVTQTKPLHELGLLACAVVKESIHPSSTGLQVFAMNVSNITVT